MSHAPTWLEPDGEIEPSSWLTRSLENRPEAVVDAVERWARADEPRFGGLEASVRWRSGGGEVSGGRMMLERVVPNAFDALWSALSLPLPGVVRRAVEASDSLSVPLIVGWDTAQHYLGKVYLNLSDVSTAVRRQAWTTIFGSADIPGAAVATTDPVDRHGRPRAPHVVGFNVGADGRSVAKAYDQFATWPSGVAGDSIPSVLKRWSQDLGGYAGVVRSQSWDLSGCGRRDADEVKNRAWFVAPRPMPADALLPLLKHLPGFCSQAVVAALPFEPAVVSSVGVSRDGQRWTLYAKPPGGQPVSWGLEPSVCVRAGEGAKAAELGLFVAPAGSTPRSFYTNQRFALSYRLRRGSPGPSLIEPLMAWACRRLDEAAAKTADTIDLHHPPEPWYVIDAE